MKRLQSSTNAANTLKELSTTLALLMQQRISLVESATILYMSSLQPMIVLREKFQRKANTTTNTIESVTEDDADDLTLAALIDSETTSLSPTDLDTLKSLGIDLSPAHNQDDDYKDTH
ncbi:hypothetical protein IQ250_02865 [Pseudanabaenaceae cyanobacterium LEGE 13415]|nr:hypothetical protein [Pseudanabaenaceae cyanobacterium LEGE 13415]